MCDKFLLIISVNPHSTCETCHGNLCSQSSTFDACIAWNEYHEKSFQNILLIATRKEKKHKCKLVKSSISSCSGFSECHSVVALSLEFSDVSKISYVASLPLFFHSSSSAVCDAALAVLSELARVDRAEERVRFIGLKTTGLHWSGGI